MPATRSKRVGTGACLPHTYIILSRENLWSDKFRFDLFLTACYTVSSFSPMLLTPLRSESITHTHTHTNMQIYICVYTVWEGQEHLFRKICKHLDLFIFRTYRTMIFLFPQLQQIVLNCVVLVFLSWVQSNCREPAYLPHSDSVSGRAAILSVLPWWRKLLWLFY